MFTFSNVSIADLSITLTNASVIGLRVFCTPLVLLEMIVICLLDQHIGAGQDL